MLPIHLKLWIAVCSIVSLGGVALATNWQTGCEPAWDATPGQPGMDQTVRTLAVFDAGDGAMVYAGGSFTTAGGELAESIARWNGTHWEQVGGGVNGPVRAMTVFDDGSGPALFVGGLFTQAGDTPANNIAKWDGHNWKALAGGTSGNVRALAAFEGSLYVGGQFFSASGVSANRIARWNGFQWTPLGSGMNERVDALTVFDDGSGEALYAGGEFTVAGPVNAARIARWNGSTWSVVGGGANARVWALAVFDAGDEAGSRMIAAGDFVTIGGLALQRIAAWDGQQWSPLGAGVSDTVRALAVAQLPTGPKLIAGGDFSSAVGQQHANIAQWNGTIWNGLGTGTSGQGENVRSLVFSGDEHAQYVYVGGQFSSAGDERTFRIARWGCAGKHRDGDLNGDGVVDVIDLLILLSNWGVCEQCDHCDADLNDNCTVGTSDLIILLSNWG